MAHTTRRRPSNTGRSSRINRRQRLNHMRNIRHYALNGNQVIPITSLPRTNRAKTRTVVVHTQMRLHLKRRRQPQTSRTRITSRRIMGLQRFIRQTFPGRNPSQHSPKIILRLLITIPLRPHNEITIRMLLRHLIHLKSRHTRLRRTRYLTIPPHTRLNVRQLTTTRRGNRHRSSRRQRRR